jgi:group I intron endonuclease
MKIKKCGIYRIINKINKKCYIGASKNIENRFYRHKRDLLLNNHHSGILQLDYNNYGENNFVFEILVNCLDEQLSNLEKEFIEFSNSAYNIFKVKNNNFKIPELLLAKFNKYNKERFKNKGKITNLIKKDLIPSIIEDINLGKSCLYIMEKFGISQPSLLKYRKIINKESPSLISEQYKISKPEYNIENLNANIKSLLNLNFSTREIGKILKIGKSTVHYRIKTYNLKDKNDILPK